MSGNKEKEATQFVPFEPITWEEALGWYAGACHQDKRLRGADVTDSLAAGTQHPAALLTENLGRVARTILHANQKQAKTDAEVSRLQKMVGWLAGTLAELHDKELMLVDGAPEGSNRAPYWLDRAEKEATDTTTTQRFQADKPNASNGPRGEVFDGRDAVWAREHQACVQCQQSVFGCSIASCTRQQVPENEWREGILYSVAGLREYYKSGLCEFCFDNITNGAEESHER